MLLSHFVALACMQVTSLPLSRFIVTSIVSLNTYTCMQVRYGVFTNTIGQGGGWDTVRDRVIQSPSSCWILPACTCYLLQHSLAAMWGTCKLGQLLFISLCLQLSLSLSDHLFFHTQTLPLSSYLSLVFNQSIYSVSLTTSLSPAPPTLSPFSPSHSRYQKCETGKQSGAVPLINSWPSTPRASLATITVIQESH